MSSTNRGGKRIDGDWYSTPAWTTRAILPHLNVWRSTRMRVLDPCAGKGAILDVVRADWPDAIRLGFEIDQERATVARVGCADALLEPWPGADVVLTNPPFSLAMEFVTRSAEQCPKADRAFLLRLAFLASQERAAFHKANPCDLFVLGRRPSFAASLKCAKNAKHNGCGWQVLQELDAPRPKTCPSCGLCGLTVTTSDSADYAWMIFGPGRGGRWSILETEAA